MEVITVGSFGVELSGRRGRGMFKIRDDSGAVVTEEETIADVATAHFESPGRGVGR